MKRTTRFLSVLLAVLIVMTSFPVALGEESPYQHKYDPAVDVEMTKMIYQDHAEKYAKLGETVEDNRWLWLFRDELGVNVTYKFVATAGDSYDTKNQMMMASGNLPDIFVASLHSMAELQEAGKIWDMTEVYEEHLSPLAKRILEADGGGAYKACLIDGRLYAIPQVTSIYDTLRFMYIRRDWMEALDLEAPNSIDDLLHIMEAFATQDPDGNGVDDTYATYVDKDLWTMLEGFFWMFGAYPNGFVERDGVLKYGALLPEAKEALRTLQMMYTEGWLDKEFVVKNFGQAKEAVTNGKVGVVMGYHWTPLDVTGPMHELYPDVAWDCYAFPTQEEGVAATVMVQSALSNPLVVNIDFPYPEIAAYMINLYVEKMYGENSEYGYYGDDVETGVQGVGDMGPLYILEPDLNLTPYRDMMKVHRGEMTVDELNTRSRHYYEQVQISWAWDTMWGTGDHTAGTVLDFLVSTPGQIIQNAYVAIPTETQAERGASLAEILKTAYTQIITGKLDVDEGFDTLVRNYMNAGGQQIEDEINEWYQINKQQ